MRVRVRVGKELAHGGGVCLGGTEIDLEPAVAHEVRHLVDEVTAAGEVRPIGAGDQAAVALELSLASARPHERISLLEQARVAAAAEVTKLDQQIAAERTRSTAETAAAAKPVPTPPAAAKPSKSDG